MCGASDQQKQISDEQQKMYKTLNDNYSTMFGQQQQLLGALTSTFQPILQAGPLQAGYSPQQATALDTKASETIASQYAAAQRATAQALAARSGNVPLPSSTSANILAANANEYARQRAQALNQNTISNYDLGYKNWQNASTVLSNVANLQNPNAYAGSANQGGSDASTTAYQIAQANNSPWTAAIGAVGALGGAALGNIGGISSMFGKGATQVLSSPSSAISNYNSWANMAPPSVLMPSQLSGMGGTGLPTFGG